MQSVSLTSIWHALGWENYLPTADICVTGVKADSRTIVSGDLFIANTIDNTRRIAFIKEAQAMGAAVIAVDANYLTDSSKHVTIPVWGVPDLVDTQIKLARQILREPSSRLCLVGITGTNGKTSVASYLAQSLTKANKPCGLIGTTGYGLPDSLQASHNTTPDGVTIQSILAQFVQDKITHCAMEVSSHGLSLGRINGCQFDVAVFTNLSTDHLDFHKTMAAYGEAKCKLFKMIGLRHAVVNIDDPLADKIISLLDASVSLWTYSLHNKEARIHLNKVEYHAHGTKASIVTPSRLLTLDSGLYGTFNLSNILATIACLLSLDMTLSQVQEVINDIHPVAGRMEKFTQAHNPVVIVDYAHTPEALRVSLQAIRTHFSAGKIICVFGCGGDRDASKRPLMAEISEALADKIIITDDNPRTESNQQIIDDILQGFSTLDKVNVMADRADAIQASISMADVDDVVLIAGKGHETYQIIEHEYLPFSDREQVKRVLQGVAA